MKTIMLIFKDERMLSSWFLLFSVTSVLTAVGLITEKLAGIIILALVIAAFVIMARKKP